MERLFHLRVGAGVVVAQVVPGSAAAKAGLRPGDVIVALGGTKVTTVEDLFAALRGYRRADRLRVTVVRNGKKGKLSVTLSARAVG